MSPLPRTDREPPLAHDAAPLPGTAPDRGAAPLSQQLRAGTRRAHRWVERLASVRGFLRGLLDLDSYQKLLRDLYAVYGALEAGLRLQATHPVLAPLLRPELFRQAALAADLDFLHGGPGWRTLPASAAAQAYVQRLQHLAQHEPVLLIAHCYTRYLGDLSGGPILRRMAAWALRLDDRGGLRFYDFPSLGDPAVYKAEFRRCLDQLPLTAAEQGALVGEAIQAFTYSGALFAALQLPLPPGRGRRADPGLATAQPVG